MPNIVVKIPTGVFDADTRARLVAGINNAAAHAERIPNDPKKRFLCWVLIEEVAAGGWTCGGADATAAVIPIMIVAHLPSGVLDAEMRAQYVAGIHLAVTAALSAEKRRIATSCILNEVADGTWGVNGDIWRLPDFAVHAGFEHLQNLVR